MFIIAAFQQTVGIDEEPWSVVHQMHFWRMLPWSRHVNRQPQASVCCSWVQSQKDELVWTIQDQVLSVKCPSAPLLGEHQNKTWSKPGYCLKLVTSTSPQVMAQSPPHFIWDNSAAGFFRVIVTEITKKSSGAYWCGIDRGPMKSITILKNISLVVTSSELFAERGGACLGCLVGEMKPLTSFPRFLPQIPPAPCSLPY
uniref:Immunoglobulin subtype domain-containing protein n=1 Tax=Felis catus TaxID=9685 RepID=A0ABI7Y7K2_FELCA